VVNKEEYCEQGLTEIVAFISSTNKKALGNINEENVIILSVIVISED